jgi:hypothetical protein
MSSRDINCLSGGKGILDEGNIPCDGGTDYTISKVLF